MNNHLKLKKGYLSQISAEESDYEEFSNGLETVNDNYLALQDFTAEFDSELVNVESELNELQNQVASLLEETPEETPEKTDEEVIEEETEEPTEIETTYLNGSNGFNFTNSKLIPTKICL